MIRTLSPYKNSSDTAKTAEIMSKYRPIAPKPEASMSSMAESPKIRQSPYLRNLWPLMQARPTRTRKRGRTALSPTTFNFKRPRAYPLGLPSSSPAQLTSTIGFPSSTPARNLCYQAYTHVPHLTLQPNLHAISAKFENLTTNTSNLVTLPLLPCTPEMMKNCMEPIGEVRIIDLNKLAEFPEEKDLLLQLRVPYTPTNVIAPRPVRPVGSMISIVCITNDDSKKREREGETEAEACVVHKSAKEVEKEVEAITMPAIISDSNNKVRMANSAYKELVGQPECVWLDSMVIDDGKKLGGGGGGQYSSTSSCKRISGEVVLRFIGRERLPGKDSSRFSCWSRIEWESVGRQVSTDAYCEVVRLSCESKDYALLWKFHTHRNARETFLCSSIFSL